MTKKTVAIILSGCGVFDGSEINEVVLTALSLTKNNLNYEFFAPNIAQYETINHLTQSSENEKRNVLQESARITRGKINSIQELNEKKFQGLVIPGGFGVAKNLSNLAKKKSGEQMIVISDLEKIIKSFFKNKKPILAICIAPAIVSSVIQDLNIQITLGSSDFNNIVSETGNTHLSCQANSFIFDKENNIITTPAFMSSDNIQEVFAGIEGGTNAFASAINFSER